MSTPDQHGSRPEDDGEIPARQLWIVNVLTGVLVVALLAILAWSGLRDDDDPAASTPPASASASAFAPSPPPLSPPTAAGPPTPQDGIPSPSPTRPVVRWQGTITLNGLYDHTDLDAVPPRKRRGQQGADINGDWLKTSLEAMAPTVRLAVVDGADGWRGCLDAASTQGAEAVEYTRAGDVVCVLTSQGRVARLRVIHAEQTSGRPVVRLEVTVWDPPQDPQG